MTDYYPLQVTSCWDWDSNINQPTLNILLLKRSQEDHQHHHEMYFETDRRFFFADSNNPWKWSQNLHWARSRNQNYYKTMFQETG